MFGWFKRKKNKEHTTIHHAKPLVLWPAKGGGYNIIDYLVVSNRADPQDKAKPIGLFPNTSEGKRNAKLFMKVLEKWRKDYE